MKGHYHIRLHGYRDYETFRNFMITHNLGFDHLVTTSGTDGTEIFDYIIDLSSVELIHVFLICRVILCVLIRSPSGEGIEIDR